MKHLVQWNGVSRWLLILALTGYAPWAWNTEVGEVTAPNPSIRGDFDSLRDLLETRGWRVERDAGGSVLLFSAGQAAPQTPATAASPVLKILTVSPADMQQLQRLLETCQWNLVHERNNTLHLSPPVHSRASSTSPAADCAGVHQDVAVTTDWREPVNTRKKAWEASINWLWDTGHRKLHVGRIRDINRAYLVTVVDSKPPYSKQYELIIHKRTGQILASR